MARYFLSCMILFACFCCLPGCTGGGGEAEFVPTVDQTADELAEEEAYNKMMEEQDAETEAE